MKKRIIFGITFLLFLGILSTKAFAETGCCLNPDSEVCAYSDIDVCCPTGSEYYTPDTNTPNNQTDCESNYFYTGGEDSCLTMPESLKKECTIGCCCGFEEDKITYDEKLKLNCRGSDNRWIDNECNEENCKIALFAQDKNGDCDPKKDSTDCRQDEDFPLFCIPNYIRDVLSGNYSCCNEFECAQEVPINSGDDLSPEDLKSQCFKTNQGLNLNNASFKCYFGSWYDESINLSKGDLYQEVISRETSLYYSDIGVCNNNTCNVTLIKKLGICKNSTAKPDPVDERFKVCCNDSECGLYTNSEPSCIENNATVSMNRFNGNFTYFCDNGVWNLINKSSGGENAPCESDSDCSKNLKCIHFESTDAPDLNNYFNKAFCCDSNTECAGESKCEKDGSRVTINDNQYQCDSPNWKLYTPPPEVPSHNSAGGGCGGGSGSGGDTPGEETPQDDNQNGENKGATPGEDTSQDDNQKGDVNEGEFCKPGECAEGLVCIPYSLPISKNKESTQQQLNPNKASQSFCCKDGSCSSPEGCKNAGDTLSQGGIDYICTGPSWEEKNPGEINCSEGQCKVEDGCVDDNDTYYNITPKGVDIDLSTEDKIQIALNNGNITKVIKYKCEKGSLTEIDRWPKEGKTNGCSFIPGFSKGNDFFLLMMGLILSLFLLKRQVIDRVKDYSPSF